MRPKRQTLEEIASSLTEMSVDWMDDTAARVISKLRHIPARKNYDRADLENLVSENFEDGKTICRLFLGVSKDEFETLLAGKIGPGGSGVKAFRRDGDKLLDALVELGVLNRMTELVNTPATWSDVLVERLRSGRGRAISGQARGRALEDFIESVLRESFAHYDVRCSFVGNDGRRRAKADFAVPSKLEPRIVIESKAYAATGSKQTDVLGDLSAIVSAKRHDTVLLFVTDGLTWGQRLSDLKKIIEMQNRGEIARIYTRTMIEEFRSDLATLRSEFEL